MQVREKINRQSLDFKEKKSAIVTDWFERRKVRLSIIAQLFKIVFNQNRSLTKTCSTLFRLRSKYRRFFSEPMYTKVAKVDGSYFWRVAPPGYPSKALEAVQTGEINRVQSTTKKHHLRILILAITRK